GRSTPAAPRAPAADGRRERAADYYRAFRALVEGGRGGTEAVVTEARGPGLHVGDRWLFDATGRPAAQLGAAGVPEEGARHLVPLDKRPRPSSHHGVAYLPALPRVTLLIVSGGHVGHAVWPLSAAGGVDVWV